MSSFSAPEVSPYDPSVPDLAPETLPLDEVIKQAIGGAMLDTHVWMPAQIVAIAGNQKVDIQPLPQTRYTFGQTPSNRPVLKGVPVSMPSSATYSIKLPLAVGDNGIALFADRSLDAFLASDGTLPYDPQDARAHDLNDAVFIPGLPTYSAQTTDSTTDLVITNQVAGGGTQSQIRVLANGKVQIKNGTVELLALVDALMSNYQQLLTALEALICVSPLGPAPISVATVAALQQVGVAAQQIQTQFDTLKV